MKRPRDAHGVTNSGYHACMQGETSRAFFVAGALPVAEPRFLPGILKDGGCTNAAANG